MVDTILGSGCLLVSTFSRGDSARSRGRGARIHGTPDAEQADPKDRAEAEARDRADMMLSFCDPCLDDLAIWAPAPTTTEDELRRDLWAWWDPKDRAVDCEAQMKPRERSYAVGTCMCMCV